MIAFPGTRHPTPTIHLNKVIGIDRPVASRPKRRIKITQRVDPTPPATTQSSTNYNALPVETITISTRDDETGVAHHIDIAS